MYKKRTVTKNDKTNITYENTDIETKKNCKRMSGRKKYWWLKVSTYIIIVQVIFYFLLDYPGYFENRIPLKPALGDVCSLANYSVAYEETQSKTSLRFLRFCVFFVSKVNPFLFLFICVCNVYRIRLQNLHVLMFCHISLSTVKLYVYK